MTHFPRQAATFPARSVDSVYQAPASRQLEVTFFVAISNGVGQTARAQLLSDASNPPTTVVADSGAVSVAPAAGTYQVSATLTAVVEPGQYYKITKSSGSGTLTILSTTERIL